MTDYTCKHGGIAMGRDCPKCAAKRNDMNKGIHLDRMVAEHVMGWGKPRYQSESIVGYENGRVVALGKLTSGDKRIDFAPSRDIASAWEVVEHVGMMDKADAMWWNYTAGSYCCVKGYNMTLARIMFSQPENFPHAVCLAALDTVGISLPNAKIIGLGEPAQGEASMTIPPAPVHRRVGRGAE